VSNIVNVDNKTIDEVTSSKLPLVLKFESASCAPCRQMKPVIDELSNEFPNVQFGIIDIMKSPALAGKYGVRGLPTFIIMKDNKIIDQFSGLLPIDQFKTRINKVL